MTVPSLIAKLQGLGVQLSVRRDKIVCRARKDILTPEILALIASHKQDLLIALGNQTDKQSLMVEQSSNGRELKTRMRRADRSIPLALSFSQQRLWFLDQLDVVNNTAYNVSYGLRLLGRLDIDSFQRSLTEISRRHESLRTHFASDGVDVHQVISAPGPFPLRCIDLSGEPEKERLIQDAVGRDLQAPFDLSTGPLVRATLYRMSDDDHAFVMEQHHIITDGWSIGIFEKELQSLYAAYRSGQASPLSELEFQYADYAVWQRDLLKGETMQSELNFWRKNLEGAPTILDFPTDRPRPTVQSHNGDSFSFDVDAELASKLKQIAGSNGATLYMVLLAVYQVLLFRYTGQDNILVGSPVANRRRVELESMIGFFINTLVMRGDVSGNPAFTEFLSRIREVVLSSYDHQEVPFEHLVAQLNPDRDLGHSALFQVMFSLQNMPRTDFALEGLRLKSMRLGGLQSKFDLTLSMIETQNGLRAHLIYNTDLFEKETIKRFSFHFVNILSHVARDPEVHVTDIPLLSHSERQSILNAWNETVEDYPIGQGAHQLVEEQVRRTPDGIALTVGSDSVSYSDLNFEANRIAHILLEKDITSGSRVGLLLDRSAASAAAILGVWKSGACYVPLDVTYPAERLKYILADVEADIIITQRAREHLLADVAIPRIYPDDDPELREVSITNPDLYISPDAISHIIYTSGSTGKPKGVVGHHRGIVNFLHYLVNTHELDEQEVVLQMPTLSFDASIRDLIGPLTCGGRVVVLKDYEVLEPEVILEALRSQRVTSLLSIVPTVLKRLVEHVSDSEQSYPFLRQILVSGEALSRALCRSVWQKFGDHVRIVNQYGATECTMIQAYHVVNPEENGLSVEPAGRPICNTKIYLLDTKLNPVPNGVSGEVYVGGVGVTYGYHGQPELTQKAFIPDPFSDNSDDILFKTGDRGRFTHDGLLRIQERLDTQVKIGGVRVEPGEIESTLENHPDVKQTVVISTGGPGDEKRLAAFIREDATRLDKQEIVSYLSARLPRYMIPASYVFIDAFPMTASGKVNRTELAASHKRESDTSVDHVAPSSATEKILAELWLEFLGLRDIGVDDNFFDLGGHSMLALRLFNRIERLFGREYPLATLFHAPTVRELARYIDCEESERKQRLTLVSIQPLGTRPPLFLIPGMGGNVLGFSNLVRCLGDDQPVYGLSTPGVDGELTPLDTVPGLAAHHINEMKAVQPEGPYLLAGYSFGGVIAHEMAIQLTQSGDDIALLALLDSHPPTSLNHLGLFQKWGRISRFNLLRELRRLIWIATDITKWFRRDDVGKRNILKMRRTLSFDEIVPDEKDYGKVNERLKVVVNDSRRAHLTHEPGNYHGTAHLFNASEQHKRLTKSKSYSLFKWTDFVETLKTVEVPGRHLEILNEPNVAVMAEKLEECLQASSSR